MTVSGNVPTIRFAVISEGVYSWPLYVAQAKELFARAGVNVEITVTGSSTHQLERLISGEYDIGLQQSDHVVRGVERGADQIGRASCRERVSTLV
jgi:ABC-type nitrate/sulfonate/bicarbonate transport system substrate-binding protein